MNEKERLLKVLCGEEVDRPPVIAPGGMMSNLTTEIFELCDIDPVCAMTETDAMVQTAEAVRDITGFESLGLPFCLTVEAQALGAPISCGTAKVEPLLLGPVLESVKKIHSLSVPRPLDDERMTQILTGIHQLKKRNPDVPVIGNLSGPATLASSIIPEGDFFRLLLRRPAEAEQIIDLATRTIIAFGAAMMESGADVIAVSDPTACGEIVGPEIFEKHFLPRFQMIFKEIHLHKTRVILHICGEVSPLLPLISQTDADIFSTDSMMPVRTVRKVITPMPVMGNLSTRLLAKGTPANVSKVTRKGLAQGVNIVSPSCGLDRSTPIENIQAMCRTVKCGNGSEKGICNG